MVLDFKRSRNLLKQLKQRTLYGLIILKQKRQPCDDSSESTRTVPVI